MALENAGNLTDATHAKAAEREVEQHKFIQDPKHAYDEYRQFTQSVKSVLTETAKFWDGMHDGMHEFVDETGKSLTVARDYYRDALTGNINLGADVIEFGGAITSASVRALDTAGDYYFNQVPKGQAKLDHDIGHASSAIANSWNSLDTQHKGLFFGKQVVPFMVPGALGIVAKEVQGADLIGKAGQAITSFRGAQLIPAYAEGLAPARAIAAANVGQVTGDATDLTLPAMLMMSQSKGDHWQAEKPSQESVTNKQNDKHRMESQANKGFKPVEEAEAQARKDIEVDKERARQGYLMGQWYFRVSDRSNKYLNFRDVGVNGPERNTYWKHYRDTYARLREEDSVLREFQ